jgi:Glycosyltransferase family 87
MRMKRLNTPNLASTGVVQNFSTSTILPLLLLVMIGLLVLRRLFHLPLELLDFYNAYYPAGRLVIEHPERLYSFAESIILGFVNLPILAFLFTPFSLLERSTAGLLFTILGVISTVVFGVGLIKIANLQGLKRYFLILLLVANAPMFYSIWLGNSTHMVFLLLIASLSCLRLKRECLGGVCLAMAGLLKPPLLFMLLYFALRKRFWAIFGAMVTLGTSVGVSILVLGLRLNLVWFQECILKFAGKIVAAYNSQSVDSFLIRLMTNAPIDSWELVDGNPLIKLLRYSIFLLLIGGSLLVLLKQKNVQSIHSIEVESLEYSIFLTLTIIISPISWTHYYLFLLLPIALYLGNQLLIPRRLSVQVMMLVSILLVISPNVRSIPFQHPLLVAMTRYLLVSHFFLGGVLLLVVLLMAHWQITRSPSLLRMSQAGRPSLRTSY